MIFTGVKVAGVTPSCSAVIGVRFWGVVTPERRGRKERGNDMRSVVFNFMKLC